MKRVLKTFFVRNYPAVYFSLFSLLYLIEFGPYVVLLQGVINVYGVKTMKIYVREIIASQGSALVFSTPDWTQMEKEQTGKMAKMAWPALKVSEIRLILHLFYP